MRNTLRYPLRNISPDVISDLQEKYPNASIEIKLRKNVSRGGLDEAGFWQLIDLLDWSKTGDDNAVIEPVVAALAARPIRQIYDFKDILSQKLFLLDGKKYAENIGTESWSESGDNFHPDGFLFSRCCAVANGQSPFEAARKEPKLMPKDLEFAALLRIAGEAYQRKTGSVMHYVAAHSIETFSNKQGWSEVFSKK